MRIRLTFAKTEALRFIGHLDVYRTLERMFRRAGLPLAFSKGFKPHPRIVLASALPLGYTSQCEMADIWLEQDLPLQRIYDSLQNAAPPGLQIIDIKEVETGEPALPSQLIASEYLVTFLEPIPDLETRLIELQKSPSLPRIWRGRRYDLRPLIQEIELIPITNSESPRLRLVLSAQEGATGRPDEVILALGGIPEKARIHRTRLLFK